MGSCVGIFFFFTRILIPDVMLTFTIALAMWAFSPRSSTKRNRTRDYGPSCSPRGLGTGPAVEEPGQRGFFPVAAALIYLFFTKTVVHLADLAAGYVPISGFFIALAIAAPVAHPGYHSKIPLTFSFFSAWRPRGVPRLPVVLFHQRAGFSASSICAIPRDYNTVPRLLVLALSLFCGFSLGASYFPAGRKAFLSKPIDRAGPAHVCWRFAGSDLSWCFSRSRRRRNITRCPAIRRWLLLLGSAMAEGGDWIRRGNTRRAPVCCYRLRSARVHHHFFFLVHNVPHSG